MRSGMRSGIRRGFPPDRQQVFGKDPVPAAGPAFHIAPRLPPHAPAQAGGIAGQAGKTANDGFFFNSTLLNHEITVIQDWTEAAEIDAAAGRPDGCLRIAPDGSAPGRYAPPPARLLSPGRQRVRRLRQTVSRPDMAAGIRHILKVCKDSDRNRPGRFGRNGISVPSIQNKLTRVFHRPKIPATWRIGPELRQFRSMDSSACIHDTASWRGACHAA